MTLKNRIFYFVIVAVAVFFAYVCRPVVVVFLYDETGAEKYRFTLAPGECFTVSFLHSWARSPVSEIFLVDKENNIVLKETVYEDFGAGLPHEPEGPLSSMAIEGGKIYIRDINRIIPDLQIRTGKFVAGHMLLYRDERIAFSDVVAPGNVVIFKVKSLKRYLLPREYLR